MAEVMLGWEDLGEVAGNRIGSGFEGQGGPGRRKAAEGRQAEQDSNTGVGGSRRRAADVK